MLRHKMAALIGVVLICSTVLLYGGPASAHSSALPMQQACGYPLSACPPAPPCVVGNADAGSVTVGQTITFTLCGNFAPGAAVSIAVNGAVVLTKPPTNGAVVVVITVVSQSLLHVDDPVNAAAVCGSNTVVASGASAAGGTGTSTGRFNLSCTSTTTKSGLALTGANVMLGLLLAAALIIVGAVLVVFQRRRRQTI